MLDADAEGVDGWQSFSVRTEKGGPISNQPGFSVWKSKTSLIAWSDGGVSACAVVSRCSVPSGP